MTITTRHPASQFGRPVFLGDNGEPMDDIAGLRAALALLGWSRETLAERTGFGVRYVEEWFQEGRRKIPAKALNVLADALAEVPQ